MSEIDQGVVFTVGHSTHPTEVFLSLLGGAGIRVLVDVRAFPGSRRWPQFNREALRATVADASIEYLWIPKLGGRRRGIAAASRHTAWTVGAFRAYSDYAETEDFSAGLNELTEAARRAPTAYMCSEGLWWQCHRRIISDYLLARGWRVEHIMPDGKLRRHELTPFARIADEHLIYDSAIVVKSG